MNTGFWKWAVLLVSLTFSVSLLGCGVSLRKNVSVPVNPEFGNLGAYNKQPVRIGLFIPGEISGYVYKGKPSGREYASLDHVFPLGKGLENASLLTLGHYFRGVELIKTPEEAKNFKIVFEPRIEKFDFRYDMITRWGGSYPMDYIVPTASMSVKATAYGDGKPIWEGSAGCPEQKKAVRHQQNFDYSEDLGEVTSQEMACSMNKLAESFAASTELYNFLTATRVSEMK